MCIVLCVLSEERDWKKSGSYNPMPIYTLTHIAFVVGGSVHVMTAFLLNRNYPPHTIAFFAFSKMHAVGFLHFGPASMISPHILYAQLNQQMYHS